MDFSELKRILSNMKSQQEPSVEYSFIKNDNSEIYPYYDKENVVSLRIIPSGWKDKYHCILEWPEYEDTETKLYSASEIKERFNIDIIKLERKIKLKKIKNEYT